MQQQKYKNYFATVILAIMSLTLMVWPFGWTALFSLDWLLQRRTWEQKLVLLVFLSTFVIVCLIAYKVCQSNEKSSRRSVLIILYVGSFAIRLFVCLVLQATPFSDFAECYEYAAKGAGLNDYLANYPYLGMYSLTLRAWFALTTVSVFSAQILNIIVTSFIPVLIYQILERVTNKPHVAVVGGIAYALFPSMIVYTAVPTCETFSQFFMLLTFYLFVVAKQTENLKLKYVYYAASGLSLGLMHAYKPLFIIVAPALLMANLCYEIIPEISW